MELQHKSSAATKPSQPQNEKNWGVSTWSHRAWFAGGCAALIFTISKSLLLTFRAPTCSRPWLQLHSMLATVAAYLVADLGTGIYHWAIDNYGSADTLIFGSQIVGFQRHHQRPWEIAQAQLANNLHKTAAGVAAATFPVSLLCSDPVWLCFFGVFGGCVVFSQQFHAWAHIPKAKLPPLVAALQDAGVILGRAEHAAHHRSPYNSSYCVVNGLWNQVLDESRFFAALEVAVEKALGQKPRSRSELD